MPENDEHVALRGGMGLRTPTKLNAGDVLAPYAGLQLMQDDYKAETEDPVTGLPVCWYEHMLSKEESIAYVLHCQYSQY